MHALLAIFAVLTIADLWQTRQFPKLGIHEANPVLARLMGRYGFDELILVKYCVLGGLLIASAEGLIGLPALIVACVLQAGVVGWNAYVMSGL